jgi:hypothetical protein
MKKFLPVLILCLLVLTACGQPINQDQVQEEELISGSMADLLAANKNLKCQFDVQVADSALSSTTYVADNKVRSDFSTTLEGQEPLTSHMINDGEVLYTWTDQAPGQGVMININELPEIDDETAKEEFSSNGFNNYQAKYDYKCVAWDVDENMFKSPEGFNFMDFGDLMNQINQPAPTYVPTYNYQQKKAACAECEAIMHYPTKLDCQIRLGC